MKIVRIDPGKREPATGALFVGTAARQAVIGEGDSGQLRIGVVTFQDGAVNKFHRHTFDQVLVVTEGEGIVQVNGEPERRITAGDIIFVPAGEVHWHGAAPGRTMSHVTVATPGTTEMVGDGP
ncbi:MAG TPA: cupin domain-containing protein [Chloroflexota bacterium]|jgi:4-carboxymuconolactone decarboxylase|nr:cupin domain-containing protein [Chloroflexota bacterium]